MRSLKEYLNEKLMTFGGVAYPRFGHVTILAGGAGSGKGFQLKELLGIEGKTLDVDALKELAIKSTKFAQTVKDETGQDIKDFDMKNPENVSAIHEILSGLYRLPDRQQRALFASILTAEAARKPNLIFDVTLKDLTKLESISRNVQQLGYDKSKINLVWVLNDIQVAIDQNKSRSRVVPDEVLFATHEGVALTMKKIVDMGDNVKKYLDGDIYISFNKVGIDTSTEKSSRGGKWVSDANYIRIKQSGKPIDKTKITNRILWKIQEYIPNTKTW